MQVGKCFVFEKIISNWNNSDPARMKCKVKPATVEDINNVTDLKATCPKPVSNYWFKLVCWGEFNPCISEPLYLDIALGKKHTTTTVCNLYLVQTHKFQKIPWLCVKDKATAMIIVTDCKRL